MPRFPAAPQPVGFGNCKRCPLRETGPVATCFNCASTAMSPPSDTCCRVCNQRVPSADAACGNALCTSPGRYFESITAIAMKTGELERAILASKAGRWGWGYVFARVVLGYLYSHPDVLAGLDAIIPMPAFLAPHADPRTDHARWVLQQAIEQDERDLPLVVDPLLIRKRGPTMKMRETSGIQQRRDIGRQLYRALEVPDPRLVEGQRIMVYDDVFTTGTTLNTVARRLREAGAATITGLTLARQPWGGVDRSRATSANTLQDPR